MTLKSIVIAAGGIGSRMSRSLNRHRSKALIEYQGKPLIYYLISAAKDAGITNFYISVNEHNRSRIEAIANSMGINYKTRLTGNNFAQVPALFKDSLDYKFLVVCGHDPAPTEHLMALIDKSNTHDAVTTAYDNLTNTTSNKRRVRLHASETGQRFEMIDIDKDTIPDDHTYVRNPYVINQDILDRVIRSDFSVTAGYFVYKSWTDGGKVTAVKAIMPVEFDTDAEFERTKRYLDRRFGRDTNQGSA